MRFAYYGGAFDPIHFGHLKFIETLAKYVDQVLVSPCYSHKYGKQMTDPLHRLAMCDLALREHMPVLVARGRVKLWHHEIDEKSTGGTYLYLQTLKQKFARTHSFHTIEVAVGQDNADGIEKWAYSKEIRNEFAFLVSPRQGYQAKPGAWYEDEESGHIFLKNEQIPNISSTEIRELLGSWKRDMFLNRPQETAELWKEGTLNQIHWEFMSERLPEVVAAYIKKHGLYTDISAERTKAG